jgi:hypothetical protein
LIFSPTNTFGRWAHRPVLLTHNLQAFPREAQNIPIFFAGDILVTNEQIDWLVQRVKGKQSIDLSSTNSPFHLWPENTIHYDFDSDTADDVELVEQVCVLYSSHSAISLFIRLKRQLRYGIMEHVCG